MECCRYRLWWPLATGRYSNPIGSKQMRLPKPKKAISPSSHCIVSVFVSFMSLVHLIFFRFCFVSFSDCFHVRSSFRIHVILVEFRSLQIYDKHQQMLMFYTSKRVHFYLIRHIWTHTDTEQWTVNMLWCLSVSLGRNCRRCFPYVARVLSNTHTHTLDAHVIDLHNYER